MRKDPTENKGRVPAEGKQVRVVAIRAFGPHSPSDVFFMREGRELDELIRESMVRPDDEPDEPTNAGS